METGWAVARTAQAGGQTHRHHRDTNHLGQRSLSSQSHPYPEVPEVLGWLGTLGLCITALPRSSLFLNKIVIKTAGWGGRHMH